MGSKSTHAFSRVVLRKVVKQILHWMSFACSFCCVEVESRLAVSTPSAPEDIPSAGYGWQEGT